MTTYTIKEIAEAVKINGSHYFDKETLEFFGQRLNSFKVKESPKGQIFIFAPSYWYVKNGSGLTEHQLMAYSVAIFDPKINKLHLTGEHFNTLQEVKQYIKKN